MAVQISIWASTAPQLWSLQSSTLSISLFPNSKVCQIPVLRHVTLTASFFVSEDGGAEDEAEARRRRVRERLEKRKEEEVAAHAEARVAHSV